MQDHPQKDGNDAPNPPPSTDKHYYEKRMGVSPTMTTQVAFKDSSEDGKREFDPRRHIMGYTQINGREPRPFEKGVATAQNSMGKYNDDQYK